jgi:hypothetical protein
MDIKEEDGFQWRFTGVYGESQSDQKYKTLQDLRAMHRVPPKPWLCVGDFNEILFTHEKEGGRDRHQSCMDQFREALEFCDLSDLGFEGDIFTWRNHNHCATDYIRERLDRAVANDQWRMHFPGVRVVNGDPRHSDHRPVIITTDFLPAQGKRWEPNGHFHFEASWMGEETCAAVVTGAWKTAMEGVSPSVHTTLRAVASDLQTWSRNVLGDLEKRRKKIKMELERCRRGVLDRNNVAREEVLRYRLEKMEEQIDIYWKQRAHVRWLEKGDRNTSFFHAACKERRRFNRIAGLKRDDGSWVEDDEEKRGLISNYFHTLFRSNGPADCRLLLQAVDRKVTGDMNADLVREFSREEVKCALDSIGDMKAPGPDGMPSIFYKQFWEVVGEKVIAEVLQVLNGDQFPAGWNETTIVLIPKVPKPDKLKDLRPISLCNVLYKIVSKVLANRLKKVLPDIISPSQSRPGKANLR